MANKTSEKNTLLYFSGIPVICGHCGKQVSKISYGKSKTGEYLCTSCKSKN